VALLPLDHVNLDGSNHIGRHDPMHSAARTSYRLDTLGLKVSLQCVLGAGVACGRFFDSE